MRLIDDIRREYKRQSGLGEGFRMTGDRVRAQTHLRAASLLGLAAEALKELSLAEAARQQPKETDQCPE